MSDPFIERIEVYLATIVRLFAMEGVAKEVAILANSKAEAEQTDYDNWNGGIAFTLCTCGFRLAYIIK